MPGSLEDVGDLAVFAGDTQKCPDPALVLGTSEPRTGV